MMRRYAGIGLLIVGCAAGLVHQARHLGLTVDETSHFAAAYVYWLGEGGLQPADAPPLTQAICGWVPRLLGAPRPRDTNGWKERDAYLIGAEILDRPNIRARRLLFYTRLPLLVFPLVCLRGLEILAHPQCGPVADYDAGRGSGSSHQVYVAAAGHCGVRVGSLERSAPPGCDCDPIGRLYRNP